ncbi:hypothetical protein V1226_10595 [Lachnospiraceae bacterium JLR.KK009]
MKQIVRVMSDMVLPGIICAALLAAIGGMSLLPRLGEHMDVPGKIILDMGMQYRQSLHVTGNRLKLCGRGQGRSSPGKNFL